MVSSLASTIWASRTTISVTAPILAFDRNLSPDIPVVSSDNYGGGVLAAQTLVELERKTSSWLQSNMVQLTNRPAPCWLCFRPTWLPIINVSSDFSPVEGSKSSKSLIKLSPTLFYFRWFDSHLIEGRSRAGHQVQNLKIIGYSNYFGELLSTVSYQATTEDIAHLSHEPTPQRIAGHEVLETTDLFPTTS